MKIILLSGFSNSGKTTIIEKLSKLLIGKGYKIGVIKHTHSPHFTIDERGKDTWRFAQSGAKIIVSLSDSEIAIIKKRATEKISLEKIINIFRRNGINFLFVEGFHGEVGKLDSKNMVRILCAKTKDEAVKLLKQNSRRVCITGLVAVKLHENELDGVLVTNDVGKIASMIIK